MSCSALAAREVYTTTLFKTFFHVKLTLLAPHLLVGTLSRSGVSPHCLPSARYRTNPSRTIVCYVRGGAYLRTPGICKLYSSPVQDATSQEQGIPLPYFGLISPTAANLTGRSEFGPCRVLSLTHSSPRRPLGLHIFLQCLNSQIGRFEAVPFATSLLAHLSCITLRLYPAET